MAGAGTSTGSALITRCEGAGGWLPQAAPPHRSTNQKDQPKRQGQAMQTVVSTAQVEQVHKGHAPRCVSGSTRQRQRCADTLCVHVRMTCMQCARRAGRLCTYAGSSLTPSIFTAVSLLTIMGDTLYFLAHFSTMSVRPTFLESPQFLTRSSLDTPRKQMQHQCTCQ